MAKATKPRDPFADKTPRAWFRIEKPKALTITIEEDDETTESEGLTSADVYIYDIIGGWFGIEAIDFVQALSGLDVEQINLFVNSPGGDVFDATAITNALRRHPANVTATVDGIAASAASFILTAANEVVMGQGSSLMLHDAWVVAAGNAEDLRNTADVLDKLSDNIAGMYAGKAGGTVAGWRQVMLEETWLNAEEAVALGLADSVADAAGADDDEAASNVFDLHVYAHAGRGDAPAPSIKKLRAVALGGPAPKKKPLVVTDRKNLTPASADVTDAGEPAEQEDAAMAPTKTAPTEPDITEDAPAALAGFDMEAFAAASAAATATAVTAALEPLFAQAPTAGSPGVPSSLTRGQDHQELSFAAAMQGFTNRAAKRQSQQERDAISSTLTTAGDVFDALTNVSFGDATAGGIVHGNPPQWIGELVGRVHIPGLWELINHSEMINPVISAFVYQTEPTGGTKADGAGTVTSTGAKWIASTFNALRWAGADSFDRMAFDFGVQGSLLESYFRVQLLNYLTWREGQLMAALVSGLTPTYNNAAPANSIIPQIVNQILTGVVNVFTQGGGLANMASVTPAEYLSLIRSSQQQAPAFVTIDAAALTQGEIEGKIVVRPDASGTLTTGQALVANGDGITGYELPGAPVRAEQLQVSIGNIDVGLFGYCAVVRESTNYVSLVGAGS